MTIWSSFLVVYRWKAEREFLKMDLKGKNAIVVGGVTGIGLFCARAMLQNGLKKVAIIDHNASFFADLSLEMAKDYGSNKCVFYEADVSDSQQFEKAFNDAKKELEEVHIVLNNAAILAEKIWEKMVDINLKGSMLGTKLASQMMAGTGGVIVNTCSIASVMPHYWLPVYSSTKIGLLTYTQCLAEYEEVKRTGTRYLALCPGGTDTPLKNGINKYGVVQEHDIKYEDIPKILIEEQGPECVAESFIRMVKEAANGAVWLVNGKKTYQVSIPKFPEDYTLTELQAS